MGAKLRHGTARPTLSLTSLGRLPKRLEKDSIALFQMSPHELTGSVAGRLSSWAADKLSGRLIDLVLSRLMADELWGSPVRRYIT